MSLKEAILALNNLENGTLNLWQRLWSHIWTSKKEVPHEEKLRDAIEELIEESETTNGENTNSENQESGLLKNVLKFTALTARDVMVPRADIIAASEDVTLPELIELVKDHGHSRLPIYKDDLDNVIGIIHIKDLLPHMLAPERFSLQSLLRDAIFVVASIRVMDLLLQMRLSRAHMALVVDEFGGIDGLITIEDMLEEITGEIEDEHDQIRHVAPVILQDGTCYADARTTIDDFEERVGNILTEEERQSDIDTLGGLIMSLTDRVPARGELVLHPSGLAFEILDADPRRIKRLRIRNLDMLKPPNHLTDE